MEITWLGHSAVRLDSRDLVLITDPFPASVGYNMTPHHADIVTISNSHPHHSHTSVVAGNPKVLHGPGEYEVRHFYISGVATANPSEDSPQTVNTVFSIQAEGLTICHLGDLTQKLTPSHVDSLGQPDVLIVPAGGTCTLSIEELAEMTALLRPRLLIPVHYRSDDSTVQLDSLAAFLPTFGATDVSPQNRLNVTQTNLPAETRTILLTRQ